MTSHTLLILHTIVHLKIRVTGLAFYIYMKLKHDPEFHKWQKQVAMKHTLLRYHISPKCKEKVNKRRQEMYRKNKQLNHWRAYLLLQVAKMLLLLIKFYFFYYNLLNIRMSICFCNAFIDASHFKTLKGFMVVQY